MIRLRRASTVRRPERVPLNRSQNVESRAESKTDAVGWQEIASAVDS